MVKLLKLSLLVAVVSFGAAAVLGWRVHIANPTGLLLYTPNTRCPPLAHGFEVGLWAGVVFLSIVAVLVALLCLGAAQVRRWEAVRPTFRRTWQVALLAIPLLLICALSEPFFETLLPQQKARGCE